MENFMQQMLAIEQSRVDREATCLDKKASVCKKEKAQAAGWRELDHQAMADQQDCFMRLLEGVQGSRARTPPPPPAPRLHFQKFIEETDNMSVYLGTFEAIAHASEWPIKLWSIHLRGSLSGAGLLAVSALPAVQQADYQMVKSTLLAVYQVSTETHRKKVFEQSFNCNKPDQWLRDFKQNFYQWLDSTKVPIREVVMMELVLAKLSPWLEAQMRNLNCQSYTKLTEPIVRHLGNQRTRTERLPFKKEKAYQPFSKGTHNRVASLDSRKNDGPSLRSGDGPPPSCDLQTIECYKCGKIGHYRRDCRVKVENAKCSLVIPKRKPKMPNWTKTVRINGHEITALLDTEYTKTIVHPWCVAEKDFLRWIIPYSMASKRKTYFPAASVMLEVEGKSTYIAVGVSKHITEDMLMGRDISHFRQCLKKALSEEPEIEEMNTPPTSVSTELGMVVTRAQQLQQDNHEGREHLQQEQDGPIMSDPYPVAEGSDADELESD